MKDFVVFSGTKKLAVCVGEQSVMFIKNNVSFPLRVGLQPEATSLIVTLAMRGLVIASSYVEL